MTGFRAMRHHKVLFTAFFSLGLAMLGCGAPAVSSSQNSNESASRKVAESASRKTAESASQKTAESSTQTSAESPSQKPAMGGSQNSAESSFQNSAESSSQKALEELKRALELAREDLQISEATEERIVSELEQHKNSGNPSPEVIEAYEDYLDRVRDMVNENRKIVGKMEALYAKYAPLGEFTGPSSSIDVENVTKPKVPNEDEYDDLGALDRELDDSLASFDENVAHRVGTHS